MIKKIVNGKLIESYSINKYESNIIHLIIRTIEKWEDYTRRNNNEYAVFYEDDFGLITEETRDELFISKDELNIPSNYICTHTQNKDEIHYFWIPTELITNNKKIIDKLKLKRKDE